MHFFRFCIVLLLVLTIAAPLLAAPAGGRQRSRTASVPNTPTPVPVQIPKQMNSQQMRDQIVQTAFSQLGLSYQRGGVTPRQGFDCSGFTSWVYAMVDVKLPRTSREQFTKGIAVDKTELAPGDLVFFRNGRRIGHVGVYVNDNYFIHSPNKSSEITISNLNGAGWAGNYAGARRIIP